MGDVDVDGACSILLIACQLIHYRDDGAAAVAAVAVAQSGLSRLAASGVQMTGGIDGSAVVSVAARSLMTVVSVSSSMGIVLQRFCVLVLPFN